MEFLLKMKAYDKYKKLSITDQISVWEEAIASGDIWGAASDSFGTFTSNEELVNSVSHIIDKYAV